MQDFTRRDRNLHAKFNFKNICSLGYINSPQNVATSTWYLYTQTLYSVYQQGEILHVQHISLN